MKYILWGILGGALLALLIISAGMLFIFGVNIANCTHEQTPEVIAEEVYFDAIEMNVSAYCPCESCCGQWSDGVTASGFPATGKLIAAPRNYDFGTVMEVPGYGRAVVQDRGGAIKGNKIDLFFEDKDGVSGHQRALNWGRKTLTVKVFK